MVLEALKDNGVDTLFGYPGGAVLPIYDEIFQQEEVRHILVRHEQGAGHAAEGYARSTGKPGCHAGNIGSRGNKCGDAVAGCADGFHSAGLHNRAGANRPDRLGCLSGSRYRWDHHGPAPSTTGWFHRSMNCRVFCMRRFMLPQAAGPVRC